MFICVDWSRRDVTSPLSKSPARGLDANSYPVDISTTRDVSPLKTHHDSLSLASSPSKSTKRHFYRIPPDLKVHLTQKYFFPLNKSLHLFETNCAFLPLFNPNVDTFTGCKSYERPSSVARPNEWMNVYLYTAHITLCFAAVYNSIEWDCQLVKAPLAAAISPYLISLTHPTHAWNVTMSTT